ncbi:MAG TPA: mechanosensitive ion channel family protein [Steroidobacteraceae bacterium]|nr:mechanosensitive ion channel family protein [Steroidobacteraceae bacterium]
MNAELNTIDHVRTTIIDLAVRFGPKLLTAILILIVGFIVGRWVERWLAKALLRVELEPPVRLLLARLVRAVVLVLFAIMALQNLGVELLPLIAGLGVAGAGIALAMQGVLGNMAAGLSIIFTKPFRVGEYIGVAAEEGQVQTITLFSTTLAHADHSRIVIPNRKIVGEILHNYGRIRQLNVEVGVAYGTDLGSALAEVDAVLKANPRVLKEPAPFVRASKLDAYAVCIGVQPWVAAGDFGVATGEINRAIVEAFRARHIVIPLPQREMRVIGEAARPN